MKRSFVLLASLAVSVTVFSSGITTDRMYLSGTGANDTRKWDFYCSSGMNAGIWAEILVPSNW
ncbi:MAG: hypothetical protein K2H49_02600, partial [Muribaculaceae bacterium]|nr:hypothetical protein [Muribaculaceae bacterium]